MFRFARPLVAVAVLAALTPGASANYPDAEAHQRAMNDIAATPPWDDGGYDDGYGYDDEPSYSADEFYDWSAADAPAEASAPANDPRYQAFLDGEWLFKTPSKGEADQTCSAMFLRQGVGAVIIATGGRQDPALLGFFSLDLPRSAKGEVVKAMLDQTDSPSATVDVYNAPLPWAPDFGLVFFAVPSADALIGNMLDVHTFRVSMDGRIGAQIEWTGGHAARDTLNACMEAR